MTDKNPDITDEADFELLFREYHSRLYYFALNLVNDEDTAKDIVGDVFMSVWNNRRKIDKNKLKSYLYTSTKNKCLNEIRRTRRVSEYETLDRCFSSIADDEEEWQIREKRIEAIETEILNMPHRTRHILEQCYYHHHSYKEVAEELGVTTEGIKKQLMRAMAHLRRHFNVE